MAETYVASFQVLSERDEMPCEPQGASHDYRIIEEAISDSWRVCMCPRCGRTIQIKVLPEFTKE